MAYDRIGQLDINQLITQVDSIKTDLEEIKARQLAGGDVINPIIVSTSEQYDQTAVLQVGVYEVAFDIIFTADHQADPYIYPVPLYYTMSGDPLPISSLSSYDLNIYTFTGKENGNWNDYKAYYSVIAAYSSQFLCKVYLQASDTGTMEFVSLV